MATVCGHTLVVSGGVVGNSTRVSTVELMDTQMRRWRKGAELPKALSSSSCCVGEEGDLFVVGGFDSRGQVCTTVLVCKVRDLQANNHMENSATIASREHPATPTIPQREHQATTTSPQREHPTTPTTSQSEQPTNPTTPQRKHPAVPTIPQREHPATPITPHQATPTAPQREHPATPTTSQREHPATPTTQSEHPETTPTIPKRKHLATHPTSPWRELTDVPIAFTTCTLVNNHLIAVGGLKRASKRPTGDIHRYHPHTGTWEVVGCMPTPRYCTSVATLASSGELMVVGGVNGQLGGDCVNLLEVAIY